MSPFDPDPAIASRPPKTERLAIRTSAAAKSLIEKAAHAVGISASEFVTAAACREARETLRKCEITGIPAEAGRAFVEAFERAEPAPALVDLMRLRARVMARGDARE